MRKKYNYYVNNEKVTRQEFMRQLREYCLKVERTYYFGRGLGADFAVFDKKKFDSEMRSINQGVIVVFDNKAFRRKEAK